ncbi:MAG: sigma-70 family RNA polymerase sigma factor [Chitinophagaceae bacterium]|nr:sigma-70 family RNA polymerase sigma factor [Chitinophagaceae bacterium]
MMSVQKPELSDDALLLQQMEQGSKQAFNALFEKYWDKAFSEAYKRLKDADHAKDVVQEIFAHIWIKRETLHIDNLPAYLHTAVRNQTIKLLIRQQKNHPFFTILETIPEKNLQADANLLRKEFFKSYEALVKTLPPRRQLIFKLRMHDELYTKDIAAQLGLSRKTVQNQLAKAVEQLRISLTHTLCCLVIFLQVMDK